VTNNTIVGDSHVEIRNLLLFREEEINGKIEKRSESQNGCVMKLGFNNNPKRLLPIL
jgi:hypothetical protein